MRRGYTVVEVVMVVALLAIAAGVAIPLARSASLESEARSVVEAIRALESALDAAHASGNGPVTGIAGPDAVPPRLARHLPPDFTFHRSGFRLTWTPWTPGEALAPLIAAEQVGTVVVEIRDPELQEAFLRLAHPSLWYRTGDTFAFLLPES